MREKIRVQIYGNEVKLSRGGPGISVKQFVQEYPCKALELLASGGAPNKVGDAVLSAIGGRGNLIQLNREKDCGCDEGQLQQI